MPDVSARSRLYLNLGSTRDLDSERRPCVASSLLLKCDNGLLLLRDCCGDCDLLRGRCIKDLRETKKFGGLPCCCAKQDEVEDDRSESGNDSITTSEGGDLCILKYMSGWDDVE